MLVEHVVRSGDLMFDVFLSPRPLEAIRAHQRIQQSRPSNYTPELRVSHSVETDTFILDIGGRVDGVYFFPDAEAPRHLTVEEIKTTRRDISRLDDIESTAHWAQLKVYAHFCALQYRLNEIESHLTYCQIESGAVRTLRRNFSAEALAAFFDRITAAYLQWAEMLSDWYAQRDIAIRGLAFPFRDYRPGQRDMAVAVYRTVRDGGHLMVSAATGIGKTMAVLFPAVKSMAEGYSDKIFYLTARTTARTVAEDTLALLRSRGLQLRSVTLTAKDKICFCPAVTCHPDECEFARGYYDRLNAALHGSFQVQAFDREAVERTARAYTLCPFAFSLELSLWADCIIADYNYVFDPQVYLRRFFAETAGSYTFLVDEAHNLVDRAREMFSAEIAQKPMTTLRRRIRQALPNVCRRLSKINAALKKCSPMVENAEGAHTDTDPPAFLYPPLQDFLHSAEAWLRRNEQSDLRAELTDLYFTASRFMRASERYNDHYATVYTRRLAGDIRVRLFCIDPAEHLREALTRGHATVFFSATLTPASYFQKILGCHAETVHLALPSPFPPENFALFTAHRISTYYKDRPLTRRRIARIVDSLVSCQSGNYLVFFPSYEYLTMVLELFVQMRPELEVIVQTPMMPESDRQSFLDRFDAESPGTRVGFAVMGGIFGEGIDLAGKRLSGAVIVGLGLPGICPERERIRRYFDTHGEGGFEFAYLYPGINRVLQAAGRVIRTRSDRGLVLLIDPRFSTRRIRALLPPHWDPMPADQPDAFERAVSGFWNGGSPAVKRSVQN